MNMENDQTTNYQGKSNYNNKSHFIHTGMFMCVGVWNYINLEKYGKIWGYPSSSYEMRG